MGRPWLGAGEIRRITWSERIYQAYTSRLKSKDWYQWDRDNPELARILNEAAILAGKEDG
jgi:hypothetical protein